MKIGIDARLWQETGVGRYIRALVAELGKLKTDNEFVLFLTHKDYDAVELPNQKWQKILADVHWHTIAEQLKMPQLYKNAGVDLVHIPYFAVPIFTSIPFVVTIHDLTISHFATGKATTLPTIVYQAKRFGYKFVLAQAIKKAQKIITVSETVKKEILAEYHISADRVIVTYESGEMEKSPVVDDKPMGSPYLLYVGNAHPHKNLDVLIEAFEKIANTNPKLQLVFIGKLDFFYERLQKSVQKKKISSRVHFIDYVTNAQLKMWYQHAGAFVFPSKSEGFGIPGLEAMQYNCPVIASDISIFHEIYGEAAYYSSDSSTTFAQAIEKVLSDKKLTQKLQALGMKKVQEYSWKKMAEETLGIYEGCNRL